MTDTASEGTTFATIHPPESISRRFRAAFLCPKVKKYKKLYI